jgi:hypothetical protein
LSLPEPEGKYVRQIIVYVSKAYEVFKEIFAAREKLLEMIRPHLRRLAEETSPRLWQGEQPSIQAAINLLSRHGNKIAGSTNRSLSPGSYGPTGITMTHHPCRHIMKYTGA